MLAIEASVIAVVIELDVFEAPSVVDGLKFDRVIAVSVLVVVVGLVIVVGVLVVVGESLVGVGGLVVEIER